MDLLRAIRRSLTAVVILFCLGILLLILRQRNVVGDWAGVLAIVLTVFAVIVLWISVYRATIKRSPNPKFRAATREFFAYRILRYIMIALIFFPAGLLFLGPITYEKELAQGLLTTSSVLVALSGALLGIARFSVAKKPPWDILAGRFKIDLILSLLSGFATMFLVLFWYARATSGFLEWAGYSFSIQLACIVVFLFFPKYYLK
jgi:hypothetical protein